MKTLLLCEHCDSPNLNLQGTISYNETGEIVAHQIDEDSPAHCRDCRRETMPYSHSPSPTIILRGCVMSKHPTLEGERRHVDWSPPGMKPEFFGVYMTNGDGTYTWLKDFDADEIDEAYEYVEEFSNRPVSEQIDDYDLPTKRWIESTLNHRIDMCERFGITKLAAVIDNPFLINTGNSDLICHLIGED